jgi:hypothetical protein
MVFVFIILVVFFLIAAVCAQTAESKVFHGHKIPWSKKGNTGVRRLKAHHGLWKK